LDIEEKLTIAGPERSGRFHHALRYPSDAHISEPDDGGDSIDHGGEHSRHFSEAEKHHCRDEVDEAGHGLHPVKEGAEECLKTVAAGHEYPDRKPDDKGHCHRGGHDGQSGHGMIPETEDPHHEDEASHNNAVPPFAHAPPCRHGHDDKDHWPRYPQEDLVHDNKDLEKSSTDCVKKCDRIDQDPLHDNVDPLLQRDIKFFWKLKHFHSPGSLQCLPGSCSL